MQRLFRAAFWAAVVFTFVMATLPKPPQLPGSPDDKVLHIIAFTTLAAMASVAYARMSWTTLIVALAAFGALIEFTQMIPALHRDADLLDWIADVTAAGAVLLLARLWLRLRRAR